MRWVRLAAVAAVSMMTVSGCWWDSGDVSGRPVVRSGAAGPCTNANPPPPTSPDLDPADCRWSTSAEEIVGFDDLVIVTEEVQPGQFTMSALRAQTGEPAWTTPRLDGRDRKLKIVHWRGKPFASVRYQTGKGPAATFVSLAYDGDRTPVTWTSPDDRTRLHEQAVSSDDVVVIEHDSDKQSDVCEKIIDYAVIDPTNGRARPLSVPSCLSVDAFGDGWYARPFGSAPFPVAFNDYDEKLLWQVDQFTPEGATPDQPHDVAAGYGDYVVTRWTKDSGNPLDPSTEWVLAVHDRTGKIIATSPFGSFANPDSEPHEAVWGITTLASPNGKRLIVRGGRASVAVDLAGGKVTMLDNLLRPLSITDEGAIYGVNHQGAAVSVAGGGTWTGDATTLIPATVVRGVAVVSSIPPAGKRATAPAWAFGLRRAETARRLAPLVHLADDEHSKPIDASLFIAHSELWWAHDSGCVPDLVAKTVDERALAHGAYSHRLATSTDPTHPIPCGEREHTGREYRSNENTHPKRSEDVPGSQGFYLDLDNDYRDWQEQGAPVYWEFHPGEHGKNAFVYWFFYPYNDFINKHEGDWERIAVQVDGDTPTGVTFWKHELPPCQLPWDKVEHTGDGRPAIYAAKNAHGAYPHAGHYPVPFGRDEASTGSDWRTWEQAKEVQAQPWHGFGGGWGVVAPVEIFSGPDGPNPLYDKAAAALTDTPCGPFPGFWESTEPIAPPLGFDTKVSLVIEGGDAGHVVGTLNYLDVACEGQLHATESTVDKIVATQVITRDPRGICTGQGTVTLTPDGEDLIFTFTDLATERQHTARLHRR
jgi:hypothetical protein